MKQPTYSPQKLAPGPDVPAKKDGLVRSGARLLVNVDAENPTAGLRGLVALAVGLSSPAWLDWRTALLPLIVVFVGGVLTGLSLLSSAQRAIE